MTLDNIEKPMAIFNFHPRMIRHERFRVSLDHRNRGFQFVRRIRYELLSHTLEHFELCRIVQNK